MIGVSPRYYATGEEWDKLKSSNGWPEYKY